MSLIGDIGAAEVKAERQQLVEQLVDSIGFDNVLRLISAYAAKCGDLHAKPGGNAECRLAFNKVSGVIAVCATSVESFLVG